MTFSHLQGSVYDGSNSRGSAAETMTERPPSWKDSAVCRGADPEIFFDAEQYPLAATYCAVCPVEDECLEYALAFEREGFWGGLDPAQRKQMRRARQRMLRARA